MLASGITFLNHIGGVMANMLASGAVDHGFDPWLGLYIASYNVIESTVHEQVGIKLHSGTVSRFRNNQTLLLFLNTACLTEKQQIPIL
jgi:hypothetical protein